MLKKILYTIAFIQSIIISHAFADYKDKMLPKSEDGQ
jgi:hypothetical protein